MILEIAYTVGNPHAVNQRTDTEILSVPYLSLPNDKIENTYI